MTASAKSNKLDSGTATFETEGRLLQELGERLVARPEVALVELIKNAFDADATTCEVRVQDDGAALEVRDNGSGMSLEQFLSRWMRIATDHKRQEPLSPVLHRRRTGQKGIGRFAVRFLGGTLVLESIADDSQYRGRTRLVATFDWSTIDSAKDLAQTPIPYTLWRVGRDVSTGTSLRIEHLRHPTDFLSSKGFRTSVLSIVSPLESLDRGRFRRAVSRNARSDSGFQVLLPTPDDERTEEDLAQRVLARAWARLSIDLRSKAAAYTVNIEGSKKVHELKVEITRPLIEGLVADIRFFPRRAGVFAGADFDGRTAWTWVRQNCGVAVVDHGFRMRPYGFSDDDWLLLDRDSAHNRRDWRSEIALNQFPISAEVRARPGDNPALNIPSNFQLVGAVFLESEKPGAGTNGLTPAMDREGFLQNAAYDQLVEVVRAGIEFLAQADKQDTLRRQEAEARRAAQEARADFKAAIESIRESPTLAKSDKAALVEHYSSLARKLEEVEDYGREARKKLEIMGLLGVVAGFMTHEAARMLEGLDDALVHLRRAAKRDPAVREALEAVERGYQTFKSHVDYAALFVESMHRTDSAPFKSAPQITRIIERFGTFATDRGIVISNEVKSGVVAPPIPVAAYSGVLLNLFTNALKAVLAKEGRGEPPHIAFRAWNEPRKHIVEVLDKGAGIPAELAKRVFDPLFTTTSNVNNPLGSGMGLGLSLVKEVMNHAGGRILIADPPAPFVTCFRVEFPRGEE